MFDATQESLALAFAHALAARDYARAYSILGPQARSRLASEGMRKQFETMIPLDWGEVAPIEVVNDPLWEHLFIYVALGGPRYSEAIMISAFEEVDGQQKIDAFEFGRP